MNPLSPRGKILFSALNLVIFAIALAASEAAAPSAEGPGDQLSECHAKLKEWEDWGKRNVPIHEELLKEYDKLTAKNQELEAKLQEQSHDPFWFLTVGVGAFGVGVGVYGLHISRRFFKRIRPLSLARKRLFVLLAAAGWVTLMILANGDRVSRHPVDAWASVLLTSLPVLLLTGIVFWWFNQGEGHQTS